MNIIRLCVVQMIRIVACGVLIFNVMCFLDVIRSVVGFIFRRNGGRYQKMNESDGDDRSYQLEINEGEVRESELFRIRKGWVIEFVPGPSLYGRNVALFTNAPLVDASFIRSEYRELKWSPSEYNPSQLVCKVEFWKPGSFHYYFLIDDQKQESGSGYLIVEPELMIGDEPIPLDCIQCLTVLSKCLGPIDSWKDKIAVAHQSGYNMIHFTPVQELGESNSAYSLKNQLKLNPSFGSSDEAGIQQVQSFTNALRNEWKMLSICDIVLNHTANESEWLLAHPECSYNLRNSPHLRPAYVLDSALAKLSSGIAKGDYETRGVPNDICNEDHLNALRHLIWTETIPAIKLDELFTVDTSYYVTQFQMLCRSTPPQKSPSDKCLVVKQDQEYRRLKSSIDLDVALSLYNIYRGDCFDEDSRLRKCCEEFKTKLDELNKKIGDELNADIHATIENVIAGCRYFRVQADGPRIALVTEKDPIVTRYFQENMNMSKINENDVFDNEKCKYVMAHNGWVMGASDPLKDFAAPGSKVYLRRELIAWGDSVKLRYGSCREDCPYLWEHMREYVVTTAQVFDGVRLDNCHSTPIHVAEFLLDEARKVKPDLYVAAELFTNSDRTDNIFVNKLGITSLIRECMAGWDSQEVGRLVYRFGGKPVGSFKAKGLGAHKLTPTIAHALFLDLTHDNPSPVEKRSVYDMFPSSALVSMACCASGSTMGYDQLVPHHIHVVEESRQYSNINHSPVGSGITQGKKCLNQLHSQLYRQNFDQVFVDQIDSDIICVTRHNAETLESIILFSYTAFHWPRKGLVGNGNGKGITISGAVDKVLFEAYLTHKSGDRFSNITEFTKAADIINGLSEFTLVCKEGIKADGSQMIRVSANPDGTCRINLTETFQPGSVVAMKIIPTSKAKTAVQEINKPVNFHQLVDKLDWADLNFVLYKCGEEEAGGAYDIPSFGRLVYAGLQGIMSELENIALMDDQAHPLCTNIRNGPWLGSYTANRLKLNPRSKQLGTKLESLFKLIYDLPPGNRPSYFHKVVAGAHRAVLRRVYSMMNNFVQGSEDLVKLLALGSVQMAGVVESAPLPPLSSQFPIEASKLSLAAGLPHFSTGYMRNWGRDTFIALRGMFLLTGRYDDAKHHILGYAGCLTHGLIPNLLDGGFKARFNCRDSVWWWLYTIKCYTGIVEGGDNILHDKVNRIIVKDDDGYSFKEQELHEIVQEALEVHFQGLCFRERNAGPKIDAHMTSLGFDNQIGVHPVSGFVFGGNEWNCGTWMDKMGSSEKAGTRGKPATPRDGSAVELVGLCKAILNWLNESYSKGTYPKDGVTRTNKDGTVISWTWLEWANRIQEHFESEFFVDDSNTSQYVNKRGIYKDSVGSVVPWTDFQLRPNILVAMAVAPELFNPTNAWRCLEIIKEKLVGPLGVKTLDPDDWAYRGDYDNSNDSADASVAHGYNYHQGPEWVWLMGYYLRARLHFSKHLGQHEEEVKQVKLTLRNHWNHIVKSSWKGLPELTNSAGKHCDHSCPTQAWSVASILEVVHDLKTLAS